MEYPNRKYPRLKTYDYSLPGYYYVTIHIETGAPNLSVIRNTIPTERAKVCLTKYGVIAKEQLLALDSRYSNLKVDKYVIMPTQIPAILRLLETDSLPRPSIPDIVGAYKSLTTREMNSKFNTPGQKQFQRSFYETILRNEQSYQECWLYIDGNPDKWYLGSNHD